MHCGTYRALWEGFASLAERLKEHVWLEEQLLAALLLSDPASA